jgi:protein kinase C substrate 80K-H
VNKGYKPIVIPGSRVDDSVCDCCDGSDEIATGRVKCANTCGAVAAAFRAEIEAKTAGFTSGYAMRKKMIDDLRNERAPMKARLQPLEDEIAQLDGALLSDIDKEIQEKESAKEQVHADAVQQAFTATMGLLNIDKLELEP